LKAPANGHLLLGSERFVERLTPRLREKRPFKEVPRRQRFANRPKLSYLFSAHTLADRARCNEKVRLAHVEHGYSLSDDVNVLVALRHARHTHSARAVA